MRVHAHTLLTGLLPFSPVAVAAASLAATRGVSAAEQMVLRGFDVCWTPIFAITRPVVKTSMCVNRAGCSTAAAVVGHLLLRGRGPVMSTRSGGGAGRDGGGGGPGGEGAEDGGGFSLRRCGRCGRCP